MGLLRRLRRLATPGPPSPRRPGAGGRSRYDTLPPPPACPEGWRSGPPDYVIVGVQKSGTTWWQALIEAHPDVVPAPVKRKELHYFDHFWDRWPTPADVAAYHAYFPRPEGRIRGEKTPDYICSPWVPPMLAQAAPETHVIALLRDPVERYHSALGLLQRTGVLRTARERDTMGRRDQRIADAMERGCYARQLEWLDRAIPPERILLLQLERCIREPQAQLDVTFAFLGLPPYRVPQEVAARARRQASDKPELPEAMRVLLRRYYEPDVRRLRQRMPDLDLSLWPNFGDLS